MRLEHIGGLIFVGSALVFGASYLGLGPAVQYKKWAEYGAIAGAAIWGLGMLT